ncbi:MAG: 4-oxalocrotonate tautomerase DmpI [Candidatus Hermodarchaeota archaeon]
MPNITIDGPKIENLEAKRNLIKEITIAVEKAYNIPKEHIIVVIKENLPENVGIGGILISDRRRT